MGCCEGGSGNAEFGKKRRGGGAEVGIGNAEGGIKKRWDESETGRKKGW